MATNPFETDNPFSVTAPAAPSTAGATLPGNAQTSYADASTAGSTGYDATTATTQRADATLRTVQDNELVQRQLEQIIGNDSPLIQRARARAQEGMASRGLVNSSMALGAADAAAYDVALPIAQADAGTFSGAARDNQAVQNSMAQFNAGESNTTSRTNAGLINTAAQFGADAGNRAELSNADAATRVSMANAGAANQSALQSSAQQANAAMQYASDTNRAALQANDQQFRAAMGAADASTRGALAQMENEFAEQRQSSAAASEVYRQFQSSATMIMTSDLPAESKQQMINELQEQTRRAMLLTSALDASRIDEILTMAPLPTRAGAAAPAADPAAAPGAQPAPGAAPAPNPYQPTYLQETA